MVAVSDAKRLDLETISDAQRFFRCLLCLRARLDNNAEELATHIVFKEMLFCFYRVFVPLRKSLIDHEISFLGYSADESLGRVSLERILDPISDLLAHLCQISVLHIAY